MRSNDWLLRILLRPVLSGRVDALRHIAAPHRSDLCCTLFNKGPLSLSSVDFQGDPDVSFIRHHWLSDLPLLSTALFALLCTSCTPYSLSMRTCLTVCFFSEAPESVLMLSNVEEVPGYPTIGKTNELKNE